MSISREFWPTSALGWFVVMPSAQGLRGWAAKLAIPRCTPGPNESARTHPVKGRGTHPRKLQSAPPREWQQAPRKQTYVEERKLKWVRKIKIKMHRKKESAWCTRSKRDQIRW